MAESVLRLGTFFGMLIIMGVAETVWPRRQLSSPKSSRWISNLSISFISTALLRLILPLVPSAFAVYCANAGIGLLNTIPLPGWASILVSVLALDMVIYWQHVWFHKIPVLWKVHRMHHADLDIDTSTGVRFHPIEILASMGIKFVAIAILGPPALAVLIFEVTLNGCALFNHANAKLPTGVDRWLRLLIVTPDMHRVHHSTDMREANMNFGFNFPWWDRMFKTYKPQPDKGHDHMTIGMNIFREKKDGSIRGMLTIPFR